MSVAVIQGAGGSIGSHFARHLLSRTRLQVVATSRDPDAAREAILGTSGKLDGDRLKVFKVDAYDEGSIEKAAKETKALGRVRVLLACSGVLHADKSIRQVSAKELLDTYQLNTFAHILTYKHFLPLLPTAADIRKANESKDYDDLADGAVAKDLSILASLTARVGSIGDNAKGGWVGYRSSKAATNQVIMTLQRELALKSDHAIAVALHPGTVVGTNLSKDWTKDEDAGKKEGVFTPEVSTGKLLDVLKGLTDGDGGKFLDWAGKEVKW